MVLAFVISSQNYGVWTAQNKVTLFLPGRGQSGRYLGIGLSNVFNILNPRRVIIGGGVMNAADLFLDTARQTVAECAMTQLTKDAEIVSAALGGQAGIVGAIYLAIESVFGA